MPLVSSVSVVILLLLLLLLLAMWLILRKRRQLKQPAALIQTQSVYSPRDTILNDYKFNYIFTLFSFTCVSVVVQVGNDYAWGDNEGDEEVYVNVDLHQKIKGEATGEDGDLSDDYEEPVNDDDCDFKETDPSDYYRCPKEACMFVDNHREDDDDEEKTSDAEDDYENVSPPSPVY